MAKLPELGACELLAKVGDDSIWNSKVVCDLLHELSGFSRLDAGDSLDLNSFGELSTAMKIWVSMTGAVLKGPTISSSHHAKGQDGGMVRRAWAGRCCCLEKN